MISVIIPTRNRPDSISNCLFSILNGNFSDFEIIVTDQSSDKLTVCQIKKINSAKIKYIKLESNGKSRALNYALQRAQGEIIALTDDDCFVDPDWLRIISLSFKKNSNVLGIFGRVLPYKKRHHGNMFCPSVFGYKKARLISKPAYHASKIGFGNNMSFQKKIFANIGYFKTWLGPGSIAHAAMDAEFALRMLVTGHKIIYNPKIIVYHNRWLSLNDNKKQSLNYMCGEMTCYGYFTFQGYKFAHIIVVQCFKLSLNQLKNFVKRTIKLEMFRKDYYLSFFFLISNFWFKIRGLLVAFIFSITDPLDKKNL